jgi:hypothetical protein
MCGGRVTDLRDNCYAVRARLKSTHVRIKVVEKKVSPSSHHPAKREWSTRLRRDRSSHWHLAGVRLQQDGAPASDEEEEVPVCPVVQRGVNQRNCDHKVSIQQAEGSQGRWIVAWKP